MADAGVAGTFAEIGNQGRHRSLTIWPVRAKTGRTFKILHIGFVEENTLSATGKRLSVGSATDTPRAALRLSSSIIVPLCSKGPQLSIMAKRLGTAFFATKCQGWRA